MFNQTVAVAVCRYNLRASSEAKCVAVSWVTGLKSLHRFACRKPLIRRLLSIQASHGNVDFRDLLFDCAPRFPNLLLATGAKARGGSSDIR